MWDLPGPGPEPVSPALAGGFLTTEPPGKPHAYFLVVKTIVRESFKYVIQIAHSAYLLSTMWQALYGGFHFLFF